MGYSEQILEIKKMIQNKEYAVAEEKLLALIAGSTIKNVEDENNTYYSFNNYVEALLFWKIYRPEKKNKIHEVNYSEIYYYLGFMNIEQKNYGKALEYLQEGLKWNPVDTVLIFEVATVYRMTGNIERFKAEIEKAHALIYNSSNMAKYFRELGWYYSEKRIFDLANALYTHSLSYQDTELARKELMYIAQQEGRETRFSNNEEIKKLLADYNIVGGFNRNTTQILYNEYTHLKNKKLDTPLITFLSRVLYDITLDSKFMTYYPLSDVQLGVSIKIPDTWKYLEKTSYEKFNISPNTTFLLLTASNQNVSIVCDGKCTDEQLDEAYKVNLENMKKQGTIIVGEYRIEGQKKIKQVFADVNKYNKVTRVFQNYLVVNGYLFNVSWQVSNNVNIDELYSNVTHSFAMGVVWSMNAININNEKYENNSNTDHLIEYSQEMEGYPTFKFYFPENLGEYSKVQNNIFELRKNNKQVIRVMVSKCTKEEKLDELASNWIEKTRTTNKQEIKSFNRENIGNQKVLTYVLGATNQQDRIYKILYKSNCWITISGTLKDNKSEIINTAIEKIEMIESKKEEIQVFKPIIVDCPACNNSFELKWNVPSTEKTFFCKCPNCGMELKRVNPNYRES